MLHPAQSPARVLRGHFRTSTPYGRQDPYRNVATAYSSWPTRDLLRPHLEIPEINTGRQYTLTGFSGIVTDNREGLNAIAGERGHLMLRSGTEFPMAVYRGKTDEHLPCMPSLARMPHPEDQLLSLCRSAAFENAIGVDPYVRLCEQTPFVDVPLCSDTSGLAQHSTLVH